MEKARWRAFAGKRGLVFDVARFLTRIPRFTTLMRLFDGLRHI